MNGQIALGDLELLLVGEAQPEVRCGRRAFECPNAAVVVVTWEPGCCGGEQPLCMACLAVFRQPPYPGMCSCCHGSWLREISCRSVGSAS